MKKKPLEVSRQTQKRQLQKKWSRDPFQNAVKIQISPADGLRIPDKDNKIRDTSKFRQNEHVVTANVVRSESRSKLDRTLWELLTDNMSLPYFLQFMENDGDITLVQFWLAAESFRITTKERLRAYRESVNSIASTSNSKRGGFMTAVERDSSLLADEHQLERNSSLENSLAGLRSKQSRSNSVRSDDQRELLGLSRVAVAPIGRHGQERKVSARRKEASMMIADNSNDTGKSHFDLFGNNATRQQSKSAESDAMSLYETYISHLAENQLQLDERTRLIVERNICRDDGIIEPDSFQVAQDFVFHFMQEKYYPQFLKSQYMCRYQLEVLTSGKFSLQDILFHDITMGYFMQFLEHEGDMRYFEFWLTANSVQEQLLDQKRKNTYNADEAVADCMVLYTRYFSLQATHPLDFDDHIRVDLEVNICREGGPLSNCFSVPQKMAFERMEGHFSNFLQSELYYQHLSELLGVIRSDRSNTPRSSISEGSTETTEIMSPEDQVRTSFSHRLGVDCGENPELLWQRRSRGLVIGRINEQGIYESDMEEELKRIQKHEKQGRIRQRFSRVMKKLVGGEDEEKEEMAWKIAHMIVNGISQQVQQQEQIVEAMQDSSEEKSGLSTMSSIDSVSTSNKD